MKHTDLIGAFWRLDNEKHFSAAATRLYLLMLQHFDRVGLDRSITWTNGMGIEQLGTSLRVYLAARDELVARGLLAITEEQGRGKRSHRTVYRLPGEAAPTPEKAPTPQNEAQRDPAFDEYRELFLSPRCEKFRRRITDEHGITDFEDAFRGFHARLQSLGLSCDRLGVSEFKQLFINEYCIPYKSPESKPS